MKGGKMKTCVFLVFSFLFFIIMRRVSIVLRTKEIRKEPVAGVVTGKLYVEEHTTYIWTKAATIPLVHSEEYNVSLSYNGITKVIDNKEVFAQYEDGQEIPLILKEKLSRKGRIIEATLELPE